MNILLLLTAITAILIPTLITTYLLKEFKNSKSKKHNLPILIIGITYLIFSITFLLWSIDIFKFNITDFLIVYTLVMVVQTISIVTILSISQKNKKILHSLYAFLAVIPLTILNISYMHFAIPISFFIITLTFLAFSESHKKHISILVIYSALSLIFYIISFISTTAITFLMLISTTIFLIFINSFLKDLRESPERYSPIQHFPKSPIIHFLKHLVFIIIITNFIFIGTISIHEFGHVILAKSSNCENIKIVYEASGLPHTEVSCGDTSQKQRWIIGGILLPLLIAMLLIFAGGTSIKEFALQIIGFNLMISYLDIKALGFSDTIATIAAISGISLSVLSLALLAKLRTERPVFKNFH